MEPLLEAFECIGGPYARKKERSARGQIDGQNHARAGGDDIQFPVLQRAQPMKPRARGPILRLTKTADFIGLYFC